MKEQRIQGAKAMPICIAADDGFKASQEVLDKLFTEKQRQDIAFFEENIETWANNPLYRLKFFVISGKEISLDKNSR